MTIASFSNRGQKTPLVPPAEALAGISVAPAEVETTLATI